MTAFVCLSRVGLAIHLAVLKKQRDEMASRVIWALKYLKQSGGGMVAHAVTETLPDGSKHVVDMKAQCWEEWFMDGLDELGYRVDRDEFFKPKKARRKAS